MNYTTEQTVATQHDGPRAFVNAGAGSGKTAIIVERVKRLISETPFEHGVITCVTFTRKAALEMKRRICDEYVTVSTFHALCNDWLRKFHHLTGLCKDFILLVSDDDVKWMWEMVAYSLGVSKISAKAKKDVNGHEYKTFRAKCLSWGLLTFDMLQEQALLLFKHDTFRNHIQCTANHLFVDEFQDSCPLQIEIIEQCARCGSDLYLVGDPRQAIYEWRNAKGFAEIAKIRDDNQYAWFDLPHNFRSNPQIVDLANRFGWDPAQISAGDAQPAEVQWVEYDNEHAEAEGIADTITGFALDPNDTAVLVRTNAQKDIIADALRSVGIPCSESSPPLSKMLKNWGGDGERIFLALQVAVSRNFLLLRRYAEKYEEAMPFDAQKAFVAEHGASHPLMNVLVDSTMLNLCSEGMPAEMMDFLKEIDILWCPIAECLATLTEALYLRNDEVTKTEGVSVSTVHAAKGLEWRNVFVAGLEEGLWPSKYGNPNEERRLAYVAMTRAKENLFVSWAKTRMTFCKTKKAGASKIVKELRP